MRPVSHSVSTSSMPSAATSASTLQSMPRDCSRSTRWTTVSWAIRRTQNPTLWSWADQVEHGVAGSTVPTASSSLAEHLRSHSTGSSSPAGEESQASGRRPSVTHPATRLCSLPTWTTSACTSQPGQHGTRTDR